MPMHPEYMWWGAMWLFPIVTILFVLLVVYLFSRTGRRPPSERYPNERADRESPIDILKRRKPKVRKPKERSAKIRKDVSS